MQTFIEEVNTNLDAFDIYSLFKQDKTVSLLDSGMNAENLGRYSFIGLNPFTTFKYENGSCFINGKKIGEADPFEEIKKLLGMYKIKNDTSFPYIAGAMGYFSYDLARIIEKLPVSALDDVKIPDCYFYFYDNAIIFDNLKGDTFITALGILKNPKNSIKELKEKILKGNQVKYKEVEGSSTKFISNFEKNKYKKTVEKVRNYIREGDIYITNLTQRFKCKVTKKPYEIYRDLRHINPAPFAAFMNVEDFSIISSSPERFLKIENNIVQTRPIKGTRPRGKNKEEDIRNRQELADSGKDHSELLMIVDLERNDLSKVCRPNSVKVKNLFTIEEYSTVFHLVSTITGKLKQNNTSIDVSVKK
ncbi:Aminodeoxychorismate synthase component 1 [Clostridium luticellarii]|uniref:Anthranilate synthase component 1 n=1 Tax=Clostridium luticellarii TaxID=1691940 RepID=A0A2T0B4Z1_9CLOT|nr:Aminodeoxychorismate synthase component 1 [Clostridium luticellarii]